MIIGLMAEQGFVPIEEVERVKRDAEQRISICYKDAEEKILKYKEETDTRKRSAEKRLKELNALKEQIKSQRITEEKKRDDQLTKKVGRLLGEIISKANT